MPEQAQIVGCVRSSSERPAGVIAYVHQEKGANAVQPFGRAARNAIVSFVLSLYED